MSQTSVNVIAGDDARASDINKIVADIAEIYSGGPGVPIGGVIWWWSDNTMPLNYKECNGQIISDITSPLNGVTVPNITNKFTRGVSNSNLRSSPNNGGADSINLNHAHTVNDHNHNNGYVETGNTSNNHVHFGIARGVSASDGQNTEHRHGYDRSTANSAPGTNSALGTHSVVPAFIGLVPIIRYK